MAKRYIINSAQILWLLLSLSILVFSIYRLTVLSEMKYIIELISVMTLAMMIVCAPLSIVSLAITALIFLLDDLCFSGEINTLTNSYIMLFLIWLTFFASGYIQWFIAVPRLFKLPPRRLKTP
ncbi:Uncharacterised protein [Leminorella richardii]|uniref:Uncharacterized protein n=1 Tax=Leminorella richardii TaxID=158841 RepID=A0A2X4V1D9_9GAMM|nr:Uncharacterised protein [Leminorella richardii]